MSRKRTDIVARRLQQIGEVGGKSHLRNHNAAVRFCSQRLSEHCHSVGGVFAGSQIVRIAIHSAVLIGDQSCETTLLRRNTAPADTDGDIASTIKRIDCIRKCSTLLLILRNRDRNQTAMSATLQCMNDAHRQYVIAVIANVGVKDQRRGIRLRERDSAAVDHHKTEKEYSFHEMNSPPHVYIDSSHRQMCRVSLVSPQFRGRIYRAAPQTSRNIVQMFQVSDFQWQHEVRHHRGSEGLQ